MGSTFVLSSFWTWQKVGPKQFSFMVLTVTSSWVGARERGQWCLGRPWKLMNMGERCCYCPPSQATDILGSSAVPTCQNDHLSLACWLYTHLHRGVGVGSQESHLSIQLLITCVLCLNQTWLQREARVYGKWWGAPFMRLWESPHLMANGFLRVVCVGGHQHLCK